MCRLPCPGWTLAGQGMRFQPLCACAELPGAASNAAIAMVRQAAPNPSLLSMALTLPSRQIAKRSRYVAAEHGMVSHSAGAAKYFFCGVSWLHDSAAAGQFVRSPAGTFTGLVAGGMR